MSVLAGDYSITNVRAAAILTTSYVEGTVIQAQPHHNQLVIYWGFTKGSLTSGELKVEFSNDNSTYFQETFSSISGGTSTETVGEHTQTATGNYRIAVPINDRYVKISVKGTGTVTSSSSNVKAILG